MHTVDRLEQTLKLAEQLGYTIRQEWLGGRGGGPCEIRGQKVLFIDLALSPLEQLEQAKLALGGATADQAILSMSEDLIINAAEGATPSLADSKAKRAA